MIYTLTGSRNYHIMIFIQHLMGIGIALIIYEISRKFLQKEWAFTAGLIPACSYYMVQTETGFITETVGLFFVVFTIYLLMIYQESSKRLFCILAGLSLAYANMIRPVVIIAALPLAGYILSYQKKKTDWKAAVLFLAMTGLLTSVGIVFNYYCFDVATTTKTSLENLWVATNPQYSKFCKEGIFEAISKGESTKERYHVLSREIKENLTRYPMVYLGRVWKVFKHAVATDKVWKYRPFLYILTCFFLVRLFIRRKINKKRLPALLIILFISDSVFFYLLFISLGLWVLMRSKQHRNIAGWFPVFFLPVLLGISFFAMDIYTERLSLMTQWIRDILCLAAFAFLVEWVGNVHTPLVSEPVYWDKSGRFLIPKIVFSLMAVWVLIGFGLLTRSSVKFRRRMNAVAEFNKEVEQGKYPDLGKHWKREVEIIANATGEYYKEIKDENDLLGVFFRRKKKFKKKLSTFPELYSWYLEKLNTPGSVPPQVVVGGVDFDVVTLEPGEGGYMVEGIMVQPIVYGPKPFRRTIFYLIHSFLNDGANWFAQKLLPIPGYEGGLWGGDYRVVVPGGITEDIRGKKVLVFGERVESRERGVWHDDIFVGRFVLEYEADFKNKNIKLRRVR
jgi:hypothetical protein